MPTLTSSPLRLLPAFFVGLLLLVGSPGSAIAGLEDADGDGNGTVSVAELATYIESKMPGIEGAADAAKRIDANGDGSIDVKEFATRLEILRDLSASQPESTPEPRGKAMILKGKTLDGTSVDLASLRGKVVLVDFWGTWCPPCVAALPSLQKVYKAFESHGFRILGVAADKAEALEAFFDETPLPWPNLVDGDHRLCDQHGIQMFPTTFLLDKDGSRVATDVHADALVDKLVDMLELEAADFADLRAELAAEADGMFDGPSPDLPIGFEAADADGNGRISSAEMKTYLDDRLQGLELPHKEIFEGLDEDSNGSISEEEFAKRHAVIEGVMGEGFFAGGDMPDDPGPGHVPYKGLDTPIDDAATYGALFHRFMELGQTGIEGVSLRGLPKQAAGNPPAAARSPTGLDRLNRATLIVMGTEQGSTFTAGAVLISADGLAVTNYHVATAAESGMAALTADGRMLRVTEVLAGDKLKDVALIRVEGKDLPFAPLAAQAPKTGDAIHMIHHSEMRFFSFAKGHVVRHSMIGGYARMEITPEYAPGGSGCGIYNERGELVGLVSTVVMGMGPELAEGGMETFDDQDGHHEGSGPGGPGTEDHEHDYDGGFGAIVVKHAVPLKHLRELWKQDSRDE